MNMGAPVFTAAQFSKVLGVSPRAIRKQLVRTPADAVVVVAGNDAAAWSVESLPRSLRDQLEATRQILRLRTIGDLFTKTAAPWRPTIDDQPIAWNDLTEACQQRAAARRQALRPVLETMFAQPDAKTRLAELEQAAARDLQCSLAQVRRWVNRVLARDGGREAFDVLELYLDEKLACKTPAEAVQADVMGQLPAPIRDAVKQLDDALKPTVADRYDLWKHVLTEGALIEQQLDDRKARGQALRQLVERVLKAVPGLARTPEAALRAYCETPGRDQQGQLRALGGPPGDRFRELPPAGLPGG